MQFLRISLRICLCVTAFIMGDAIALADTIQYSVTVNTSSMAANYGYVDFQFNPSSFSTASATGEVVGFATNGLLNPSDPMNGTSDAASGGLPGIVSLQNTQPSPNEYWEGMTFGTTINFDLELSGPAIASPDGDGGGTFILDFYNDAGYLFTADSQNDIPVFTLDINGDGSTSPMNYASTAAGGTPVVSFIGPTAVAATPEPSGICLSGTGVLLALFGMRKRFVRVLQA